jgi:hypothetical protein
MGPLYDTCKKCYSSGLAAACDANERESWFLELADSSVKCISYHAFEAYAKTANSSVNIAHEFKKIDVNGDGCIDFAEFGR